MAETIKLPNQVVDSDWKDDVDVDYAIYGGTEKAEGEYINKNQVSRETVAEAKALRIKLQGIGNKVLLNLQNQAQSTMA